MFWIIPVILVAYAVITWLYLPYTISPPEVKRIAVRLSYAAVVLALFASAILLGF